MDDKPGLPSDEEIQAHGGWWCIEGCTTIPAARLTAYGGTVRAWLSDDDDPREDNYLCVDGAECTTPEDIRAAVFTPITREEADKIWAHWNEETP